MRRCSSLRAAARRVVAPCLAPRSRHRRAHSTAVFRFNLFDANGDGKLSRSEVALFPPLAAAFDEADTDHDGFVSVEEVRVFSAHYRAARGRTRAAQQAQSAAASEGSAAKP